MLELTHLTVGLGEVTALKDVTLSLKEGFVAVVGPNGSGKTTLLRAVSGLIPYQGSVKVMGKEVSSLSPYERKSLVSYVPPYVAAMPDLTVGDLIIFGGGKRDLMEKLIEAFNLQPLLNRRIWEVSSGELSRALIVRGLGRDSLLYGVDEPLSHIDIRYQVKLLEVLRSISREGKLVMVATNQLNPLLNHVDSVIALKRGKLIYSGEVKGFLSPKMISTLYEVEVKVIRTDGLVDVVPVRSDRNR